MATGTENLPVVTPKCVKEKTKYIDDLVTCVQTFDYLNKKNVVSIHAEGCGTLGPFGLMSILCVGTQENECYIFDMKECPAMWQCEGLKVLLGFSKTLKVLHNASELSRYLFGEQNITLENVFDTQCAHAMIASQNQQGYSPFDVPRVSRSFLYKTYTPKMNGKHIQMYVSQNVDELSNWMHRPLSSQQIRVAAAKALILFPDIYECMKSLINVPNLVKVNKLSNLAVMFPINLAVYKEEMVRFNAKYVLKNDEADGNRQDD